jgi:PAS domain S-box-containing protein
LKKDESGKTILLVEDEALIAMAEKITLERTGYSVITTDTGEKAVEIACDGDHGGHGIDLVLMDIDLGPGMRGTEAAGRILAKRNVPLAFLSSHTEPEVVAQTEDITSYGYILKNSGDTVLLASIKMALKLHSAYASAEQEKKNLEQLFETSPLGMMLINRRYEVIRSNGAAEKIAGKRSAYDTLVRCGDFLGCVNRHLHPQVCGHTAECADCSLFSHIKQTLAERTTTGAQETPFRVERYSAGSDSRAEATRMLRYGVSPVMLDGEPAAVVTFEDTTEEHKADLYLRQFARLVESGNALVATTDPQRRTTWVNEAFEKLTGYSREELEGKNLGTLLQGPNPDQELKQRMSAAFDSAQPFETEILNFCKEGSPYWLHMDVQPLFTVHGKLEGFISIQRDISAAKRYRLALEERDQRLWSVLAEMETPFMVIDGGGRTVFVNTAFAREAEYEAEQIRKMTSQDIMQLIHEDDHSVIDEALRDAVSAHRESVSYRYRVRRKTGKYAWRQDRVRIFYDEAGATDQFWITCRMISRENDIS